MGRFLHVSSDLTFSCASPSPWMHSGTRVKEYHYDVNGFYTSTFPSSCAASSSLVVSFSCYGEHAFWVSFFFLSFLFWATQVRWSLWVWECIICLGLGDSGGSCGHTAFRTIGCQGGNRKHRCYMDNTLCSSFLTRGPWISYIAISRVWLAKCSLISSLLRAPSCKINAMVPRGQARAQWLPWRSCTLSALSCRSSEMLYLVQT